jgi:hypothetical protein
VNAAAICLVQFRPKFFNRIADHMDRLRVSERVGLERAHQIENRAVECVRMLLCGVR